MSNTITPTVFYRTLNVEGLAKQLDAGHLRAFVKTTVPLNEASSAYSGAVTHKSGYGKIVIAVPA